MCLEVLSAGGKLVCTADQYKIELCCLVNVYSLSSQTHLLTCSFRLFIDSITYKKFWIDFHDIYGNGA